jgi:tetratricopeptide (TPR) repeat protein
VLTIRENIGRAVGHRPVEANLLGQLCEADVQLKKLFESGRLFEFVDHVAQWRAAAGAGPDQWWWDLDGVSTAARLKLAWYWIAIAGLLLTISIGFMTEVATRLLKDGPDFYGAIGIVVQALLAAITGSALTEGGRLRLGKTFDWLRIPKNKHGAATAGIAVITFAAAASLYFSLPWLARLYNDHGDARRVAGALVDASDAFKRAIALQPDYAQAHYNLAVIYEAFC